ncbi:hypothetical protein [Fuerstiella marisgermanici]|uniref:Uncharacterized protein n=1 Tax=Fuerstiella marisgermanici TaxID=1891926 RepID=A0A1P8WLX6_9PLAN|nr:hypothetical protein [Fuerstiella marisgermanici]APZ95056.1 hypothetical protein Fuma_04708 [Fuerstiella marisgermanici]
MPFTFNDLAYGFAVPAVVSAVVLLVFCRMLSEKVSRATAAPLALTAGFLTGYWLLELGPYIPEVYREWLPYTVLAAGVASAIPQRHLPMRIAIAAAVAGFAAWQLVPGWEHLEPSAATHRIAWLVLVIPVLLALEPSTQHTPSWLVSVVLGMTMVAASVVLLLSGSLLFCQVAGCGAGALVGMGLLTACKRHDQTFEGLALPFTILLAGILLIGRVESFSEVPLISYLLLPAAPLMLCIFVTGPLSRFSGFKALALPLILPGVVCAVAVIAAVVAEYGPAE